MRAPESILLKNFSNATAQTAFRLLGGYYALVFVQGTPSSSNHFDVVRQAADGSTNIPVLSGSQSATTGIVYAYLPPGTYSFLVSGTLAGIYAEVVRVPFE